MSSGFLPVKTAFDGWRKDPDYVREYEALEPEFALAAALIEARACAGLTQAELAQRMCISQSAIVRLEIADGGLRSVTS